MQERVPDAQGVHPLGTRALSAAIGSSQPPPDWPTEKGYLDEQLTLLMLRSTRNSARGEEGGASGYNSHPEDKIESNHSPGPPLHGSRVPAQRPCAPSQLSTVPGEVPRNPAVTAAPANSDAEVPQTRGRPGKRKAAPSPRESKSAGAPRPAKRSSGGQAAPAPAMPAAQDADGNGADHATSAETGANGVAKHDALQRLWSTRLGPRNNIDPRELVRLMEAELMHLGLEDVARFLESRTGVACQPSELLHLASAVRAGDWGSALACVETAPFFTDPDRRRARFLLLAQKMVETLMSGDVSGALRILRSEVVPCKGGDLGEVRRLSAGLLCQDASAVAEATGVDAAGAEGRERVLQSLLRLVPPTSVVPPRRLETLLDQALKYQASQCVYLNSDDPPSLLEDVYATPGQVPSELVQVLEGHRDEVWFCAFSPDGRWLASGSKDQRVLIWHVPSDGTGVSHDASHGASHDASPSDVEDASDAPWSLARELGPHPGPVAYLAWSADGERLLAVCEEGGRGRSCGLVTVWDPHQGRQLRVLSLASPPGRSPAPPPPAYDAGHATLVVQWVPGQRDQFAAITSDRHLVVLDASTGEVHLRRPMGEHRVTDMALTRDGSRLVFVCYGQSMRSLRVHELESGAESSTRLDEGAFSVCMSRDSRHALVALYGQQLELWEMSVDGRMDMSPKVKYTGMPDRSSRFVLRPCMGGYQEGFVACGSDDTQVYVWHKETGKLLEVLSGHAGTVNCCSWNPRHHHMIASASDDGSIHIWGTMM